MDVDLDEDGDLEFEPVPQLQNSLHTNAALRYAQGGDEEIASGDRLRRKAISVCLEEKERLCQTDLLTEKSAWIETTGKQKKKMREELHVDELKRKKRRDSMTTLLRWDDQPAPAMSAIHDRSCSVVPAMPFAGIRDGHNSDEQCIPRAEDLDEDIAIRKHRYEDASAPSPPHRSAEDGHAVLSSLEDLGDLYALLPEIPM